MNSTPAPVSFATWQDLTGDTSSPVGIAGTGDFMTAMFVNAATGDLHLVSGGNPLVSNTGTPIAGVTTDFDGAPRSATAPFIGADELLTPFQQWALAAGLPLDPAANGGANLLQFAFGLNPDGSSTGGLAVAGGVITQRGTPTTTSVDYKALFGRRKNSGLTYTVQFSGDLGTWENFVVTPLMTPLVIADDGIIEACTVPFPPFLNGSNTKFFRLRISTP